MYLLCGVWVEEGQHELDLYEIYIGLLTGHGTKNIVHAIQYTIYYEYRYNRGYMYVNLMNLL